MSYDFSNVDFVIPVRLDSIYRLENLLTVVKFLRKWHANINIVESGKYNNNIIKSLLGNQKKINYYFYFDRDIVFHRTKYINKIVRKCNLPFVAVWDADVLVPPRQIALSIQKMENDTADVSYPYDGNFLDVDEVLREEFLSTPRISFLESHIDFMNNLYGNNLKGGGFLIKRDFYILAGLENERFYGWGPEDAERYERWRILGLRIHRSSGSMFHLYHPRDINGRFRSELQARLSKQILTETINSNKNEIQKMF